MPGEGLHSDYCACFVDWKVRVIHRSTTDIDAASLRIKDALKNKEQFSRTKRPLRFDPDTQHCGLHLEFLHKPQPVIAVIPLLSLVDFAEVFADQRRREVELGVDAEARHGACFLEEEIALLSGLAELPVAQRQLGQQVVHCKFTQRYIFYTVVTTLIHLLLSSSSVMESNWL
jgi:hypothetical protein